MTIRGNVKELKERILRDGKVLSGGILNVESFIHHQVDTGLMDACGRELARRFAALHPTKVLTAENSGFSAAFVTALHLNLPLVYARKERSRTMPDEVYLTLIPSQTTGKTVELIVSPEYLAGNERVLLVEDFLASGQTLLGLARLAERSGSKIVGVGVLIEKSFVGGSAALEPLGVPVESLVCITKMENGEIEFRE